MTDNSSDWIQHAIKHHGALKAKAESANMSTQGYAEKYQHDGGVTGHQARLGLTLMHMHDASKSCPGCNDESSGQSYSTEHMPKGD